MNEPYVAADPERLAALLCDWSLRVREGDQVLVDFTFQSLELLRALGRALLERGAWPLARVASDELAADFYRHARTWQLDAFAPLAQAELHGADALIAILAPGRIGALDDVDPALIARHRRATAPLLQARQRPGFRYCVTIWPTAALAARAAMSRQQYEQFIARALFLDRDDPLEAWRALSEAQEALVARLSQAQEIRIEADGTDLRLRVGGRRWINSDGRRNMPSGEVFTGPHEDSAEGRIRFSVPTGPAGVRVEDVALRFRGGEVVEARAARGEDYLRAALSTDAGARRLGELGIGTNPAIDRPTGSILLDEKLAGTVHLALGRSYPETGAANASALHWDLICDLRQGGRLTLDGEPLTPWPPAVGA